MRLQEKTPTTTPEGYGNYSTTNGFCNHDPTVPAAATNGNGKVITNGYGNHNQRLRTIAESNQPPRTETK